MCCVDYKRCLVKIDNPKRNIFSWEDENTKYNKDKIELTPHRILKKIYYKQYKY